jgi:hypothetical protein
MAPGGSDRRRAHDANEHALAYFRARTRQASAAHLTTRELLLGDALAPIVVFAIENARCDCSARTRGSNQPE